MSDGYVVLAGIGYTNYKDAYNLASGGQVAESGSEVTLITSHGRDTPTAFKIFVPPGTKYFGVSVQTYSAPQEAKAVLKYGSPPSEFGDDYITDARYTLQRLVTGDEINCYSPANSGALSISTQQDDIVADVSSGGYIYIRYSGPQFISFQTRVTVDKDTYIAWYESADWDSQGNPVSEDVSFDDPSSTPSDTTQSDSSTAGSTLPAKLHITNKNTNVRVYTLPEKTVGTLFINVTNNSKTAVKIRIAVTTNNTPQLEDFIVFDQQLASLATFTKNGLVCSSKESIWVYNTNNDCTVRIEGMITDLTKV